jgi:2-polyprenyl-3-methyl-5-hydroxy-6-metoxy-1,4-benzoquinol methylase
MKQSKHADMNWNHNTHYHGFVMSALPESCQRALDVGCGRGALTRKLAHRCAEVVAIDVDPGCVAYAKASIDVQQNITFVNGDVLTHPLQQDGFDFVVAVASLHHLPLRPALKRFSDLLRPGGVLVIVGLYRSATPIDYAFSAAALPISWVIRSLRGAQMVGAPIQDPTETLRSIRRESASLLPGSVLRRQFFFRYTLVWSKTEGGESG